MLMMHAKPGRTYVHRKHGGALGSVHAGSKAHDHLKETS
jgi:hypothetical protein